MEKKNSQESGLSAHSGTVVVLKESMSQRRPSLKSECGPNGHDTPDSMHHYSRDLEEVLHDSTQEELHNSTEKEDRILIRPP